MANLKILHSAVALLIVFWGLAYCPALSKPLQYKPIALSVQEPLTNGELSALGKPVHLVSTEARCRKEICIPEKSVFEGVIVSIKPSKRFLRPGLIKVRLEKLTLPDNTAVMLRPKLDLNIRHAEVMTFNRFNKKIMFDIVPEITLDYLLDRTTKLSSMAQDAISLAPDFVVDYTLESLYPTVPNESAFKRVVFSLLDATYIPFFIAIVRKDKPITTEPGALLQISPSVKNFKLIMEGDKMPPKNKARRSVLEGELVEKEER